MEPNGKSNSVLSNRYTTRCSPDQDAKDGPTRLVNYNDHSVCDGLESILQSQHGRCETNTLNTTIRDKVMVVSKIAHKILKPVIRHPLRQSKNTYLSDIPIKISPMQK
jgi:hypothetical protein